MIVDYYKAIHSAPTANSFARSKLLALLTHSAALAHLFTLRTPKLMGKGNE